MKKGLKIFLICVCAVLASAVIWTLWGNKALEKTEYVISDESLPEEFSGFRIVQVSDLHNEEFGAENKKLLKLIEEAEADIIVLTGDLIDSRRTDIETALRFAEKAAAIAPTYYVTGNHESRIADFGVLKAGLEKANVTVLQNESVQLERNGAQITLLGLDDPGFGDEYYFTDSEIIEGVLSGIEKSENYTVMLAHRPHLLSAYSDFGADLVLSGHAHGGQFILPYYGGVIAPGQGFFPKYYRGIYELLDTKMVVSRGLGNSVVPIRFNNRPELVVVELEAAARS